MPSISSLSKQEREEGSNFAPKFDSNGLLSCVVQDSQSKEILVLAFMNEEAIALTRKTGIVHFWSRSRQEIWKKGGTSGHILEVQEIRVDCDQDAMVILAKPAGPTCHTLRKSCFYRSLIADADNSKALVKVSG